MLYGHRNQNWQTRRARNNVSDDEQERSEESTNRSHVRRRWVD